LSAQVLWTAEEAVAATGGRCNSQWQASGLSIDSRSIAAGDLFIALAGPNHDGHDFAAAALEAGAIAALVHRRPRGVAESAPLLMVEDTLAALGGLGRASRARSNARVVGITGSVGKTGTKEALKTCLATQGLTAASVASFNNHWGVPLSLARMARGAHYGVFEMGMNQPGEILALSQLVRPHVALITNVQPAHLQSFESLQAIATAKSEIFEAVEPNGVAVLNRDNAFYDFFVAQAEAAGLTRKLGFGRHGEADVRLAECRLQADGSQVKAILYGQAIDYRVSIPGEHWVINSLAVLATIQALEGNVAAAAAALAQLEPLKGRGQQREIALAHGSFRLIDESYNANPASVRAAIAVLGRSAVKDNGRRIAVLGDMLELGTEAQALHAELAGPLQEASVDLVFSCGPTMAVLHDAIPAAMRGGHAPDSQALVPLVKAAVGDGDVVMIKGSLGSRMAVLVNALEAPIEAPLRAANGE